MTELQWGLIGLGALGVLAVLAYNTWQERRHRRLAEKILNGGCDDALFNAAPHVPGESPRRATVESHAALDEANEANEMHKTAEAIEPSPPGAAVERIEPVLGAAPAFEAADGDGVGEAQAAGFVVVESRLGDWRETALGFSPGIDYVASIEPAVPVGGKRVLELCRASLSHVHKPVRWLGYDEVARGWMPFGGVSGEPLSVPDGKAYKPILCGLQLVDRQGALGEGDLTAFRAALQALAEALPGAVHLPPHEGIMAAAAKLDALCAETDIQIGLNVVGSVGAPGQGNVFSGTRVRALAESAGMTLDAAGRFVRHGEDGEPLFFLVNQEAVGFSAEAMKTLSTRGLTFLLDVPRVVDGVRVFDRMAELAGQFAEALRGTLVDDNRRLLAESAFPPIRQQIAHYQSRLAENHLPAGSPLTRRLFS